MAETDMHGNKRATLEAMGELRVRHALAQQTLVHHLIQPAYEWLTELDERRREELKNAITQRQSEHRPERQDGGGGGETESASGGDSVEDGRGAKSEGSADASHAG
jgi:hypothetical protein